MSQSNLHFLCIVTVTETSMQNYTNQTFNGFRDLRANGVWQMDLK